MVCDVSQGPVQFLECPAWNQSDLHIDLQWLSFLEVMSIIEGIASGGSSYVFAQPTC